MIVDPGLITRRFVGWYFPNTYNLVPYCLLSVRENELCGNASYTVLNVYYYFSNILNRLLFLNIKI